MLDENKCAVNPTRSENSGAFGELEIVRLAPGDQQLAADFAYGGNIDAAAVQFIVSVRRVGSNGTVCSQTLPGEATSLFLDELINGVDYQLELTAVNKAVGATIIAAAPVRFFRTGFVPGVVVNYIHPEDYTYDASGRSPASPCLLRIPDGRLLASHDIYWGRGGQNLSKVFVSEDEGRTWTYLSTLFPCFWGKLFCHNERLYKMGTSTEYGALLIFCSDDWGKSWSEPTTILAGGSRETGGPHQAPVPVVSYHGRLWTAVEHGSWTIGGHDAGVVSVSADADLMDPNSWTATPFLRYDSGWPGTITGGTPGVLEGNVVVAPNGELINFLRYHTRGGDPDYGKAIMLHINKEDPSAPLTFAKVVDFPGNMSKFTILFDETTRRYYSLVNRVTVDWVSQRNILTLISSVDLENWRIERDVLNYQDNGWSEDYTQVGFQYVDWFFEGDHILALSRTAVNGAYNYHNANHLTFHRFSNYAR